MEELLNQVRDLYEMPDLEIVEVEVANNDEGEDGSVTMYKLEIAKFANFIGATEEDACNLAIGH